MNYISEDLRKQVVLRAKGLCEYCQAQLDIVIDMEIEHIIPTSKGGKTEFGNLCLACAGCNSFKHDFTTSIDPDTGQSVLLFHPRTQIWQEHFVWSEDGLVLHGLTACGRATIERLKINRVNVLIARKRWIIAGWHPPT